MNIYQYTFELQSMFAKYGFTETPLTLGEILDCYTANLDLNDAYKIGCDIAAGFDFELPTEE